MAKLFLGDAANDFDAVRLYCAALFDWYGFLATVSRAIFSPVLFRRLFALGSFAHVAEPGLILIWNLHLLCESDETLICDLCRSNRRT